jgi:hypothetical protein
MEALSVAVSERSEVVRGNWLFPAVTVMRTRASYATELRIFADWRR